MNRHRQAPPWPFLFVLVGLFVLTINAPRQWERVARPSAVRVEPPPFEDDALATSDFETAPSPPVNETSLVSPPLPAFVAEVAEVATPVELAEPQAVDWSAPYTSELQFPTFTVEGERSSVSSWNPLPVAEPTNTDISKTEPTVVDAPRVAAIPERREAELVPDEPPTMELAVPDPLTSTPTADDAARNQASARREVWVTEEPLLPASDWPEAEALLRSLDQLDSVPSCRDWAFEVFTHLERLREGGTFDAANAGRSLKALERAIRKADALASQVESADEARRLRQVRHALHRRVAVWTAARRFADANSVPDPVTCSEQALEVCLADVQGYTAGIAHGAAWNQYLGVDDLRALKRGEAAARDRGREIVTRLLRRLENQRFDEQQRKVIEAEPVARLHAELRHWAAEPLSPAEIAEHLEVFEQTGSRLAAEQIASDLTNLRWSDDESARRLADEIEASYRNANFRIVVSRQLLDSLMPEVTPMVEPIRERMFGTSVRGRSQTITDLRVRLIPDNTQLRMAIEASGHVRARTAADAGPATIHSDGNAVFQVHKGLQLGVAGVRGAPSQVEVQGNLRLRDIETRFDGIPILAPLVRNYVRNRHDEQRAEARRDMTRRIENRVRERIEQDADSQFRDANDFLQARFMEPLIELDVEPQVVAARTTDERLTLRLRFASEHQLAAHTPRPRAPSDSLASAQVNDSVLNNVLDQLELGGKRFHIDELHQHVAEQLGFEAAPPIEDIPRDVYLTVAPVQGIDVRFEDGRVRLVMTMQKLEVQPHTFRNFQVTAFYEPVIEDGVPVLQRVGALQLVAPRMRRRHRLAVRGIFLKAFSENRPWRLLPESVVDDPRLAHLAISQFVVREGWIGVALSPRGAASVRTVATLRQEGEDTRAPAR